MFEKLFGRRNKSGVERVDRESAEVSCASCKKTFRRTDAYRSQDTPGSAPYHPPGHGDSRPRAFCPYCGALVAEWHVTRANDFDEWAWFGENGTLNSGRPLPPDPLLFGWGQDIPPEFLPSYRQHRLDVEGIKREAVAQGLSEGPGGVQESTPEMGLTGPVERAVSKLQ